MEKQKKKQKQKTNTADIFRPLKILSKRFNLILFFVFIVACLTGAIMLINNTLKQNSLDQNYTSSISAGSIDQVTLSRLNALHTSTQGAPAPTIPPGRTNPVNE